VGGRYHGCEGLSIAAATCQQPELLSGAFWFNLPVQRRSTTVTKSISNSFRFSLISAVLFGPGALSAQYAWFSRNTDIIQVSGETVLSNQCTIEAVLMLPGGEHSGGSVYDEWILQQDEKYLGVSISSISAVAYPNDLLTATESHGLISLDKWHHIAFVCNGQEQRIYLDGLRIQSGPAPESIGNGPAACFIGYAPRAGSDFPSFVGYLDSIRISKKARYSGLSFTAPTGDLPADTDTVLLYNFNDDPASSTVKDDSPLDRVGTLGKGFAGATAPRIIRALPVQAPLGLKIYTAVELEFSSSPNVKYQVQSSPDMAVWSDMPETFLGDGNVVNKLMSTQGNGRLFYRVVARP
jgi:hypothetical protein